jgi:hypothetical protein
MQFDFLIGEAVEQIWVWGTIRLVLDLGSEDEPSVYVDVDRCSYRDGLGSTVDVDVPRAPREAGTVLELLHRRITGAAADDGTLTLRFDNQAELRAFPDAQFESWTVVGAGRVFQCLPGGDVGSW